jgi:hypothetical protein
VIDTLGIKVGPFAMVDMFGTPYTEALHVVERYRLIEYEAAKEAQERTGKENWRLGAPYKGKGLQLQFTVEDGGVFTDYHNLSATAGNRVGRKCLRRKHS